MIYKEHYIAYIIKKILEQGFISMIAYKNLGPKKLASVTYKMIVKGIEGMYPYKGYEDFRPIIKAEIKTDLKIFTKILMKELSKGLD